jgi:hypothetical protein
MKTFTVNLRVRVKSKAKAAQLQRLANLYRDPANQLTQTAIANLLGTSVQLVNEQAPSIRKLLKQFA